MSPVAVRWFRVGTVLVGLIGIAVLAWKLDWRVVAATVGSVGWGILFLLALQVVALALNALGWRLSFAPADARHYGIFELAKLWQAMDGINYFVPTGTVAGEIARTSMMNRARSVEVRTASVVVSRGGSTVAQLAFVLAGFVFLVSRIPKMHRLGWVTTAAAWLLGATVLAIVWYLVFGRRWVAARCVPDCECEGKIRKTRNQIYRYLASHPWRFLASVVVFTAAYAWLAVEGFWICRFIHVPVTAVTALTIEVLSVAIDGVLFFIPAKIGSQELGKTAIFSLLSLPLHAGLAFGVTRHARELFWALTGFGIYSARRSGTRAERRREATTIRPPQLSPERIPNDERRKGRG